MRDAHTLGPPPGAPIIWVLWEGSSCVWWVAGWGWPRHRGGVRPLGDCCWWGRMEGGPASLGDRKSHPSFWSWKRCTEPCRRLQVASFLLNSHSPPLPPSSSVPHISGTSFHLPPFLSSSPSPSLSPGTPRTPTSSFLPLPLAPCGSLPLTCPRSDSPLGVLAHLGGRLRHTLREAQKFRAVLSAESPSPPDDERTVPKATYVPRALG